MSEVKEQLGVYAGRVEQYILGQVDQMQRDSSAMDIARLFDAMRHSLTAGGKRIRPALIYAFCEACGGSPDAADAAACAMEMTHTSSLIFDDLPAMDGDVLRRGKPTTWKQYDEACAILAGDGLLNSAMDVMFSDIARHADDGSETEKRIRAAREISASAGVRGMIAGQAADVRPELIRLDDAGKLRYIHRNKTGALIKAAAAAGALGALRLCFLLLARLPLRAGRRVRRLSDRQPTRHPQSAALS